MASKIGIRSENQLRLLERELIRSYLLDSKKNKFENERQKELYEQERRRRQTIYLIIFSLLSSLIIAIIFLFGFIYYVPFEEYYFFEQTNSFYKITEFKINSHSYPAWSVDPNTSCNYKFHCLSFEYSFINWIYWLSSFFIDFIIKIIDIWVEAGKS